MDERQLYYYQVLYETGNITKTAELLYISRTGLSLSMKKLEDELGVPLFVRKNDGVVPTEYGDLFYQTVLARAKLMSDFQNELTRLRQNHKETIRIGLLGDISSSDTIRHLYSFEENEAEITIEIVDKDVNYFDALKQGTIDIAFSVCPPDTLNLASARLLDSEQVILMSVKNPLASHDTVDFTRDLRGQTILESESRMDSYQDLLQKFGILCRHVPCDHNILREMVCRNKGFIITLLPLVSLYRGESVCVRPLQNLPKEMDLNPYLVYRKDSSPAVRKLVRYITENLYPDNFYVPQTYI
jgi:DNA-binding transcriptional LysR family regulator